MSKANPATAIPTKILVPVDFSPSSHAALETAVDLAQHFHAEIHLLHVIPIFPVTSFPDFIPESKFLDEARSESERHFKACQAALAGNGIKISYSVEEGNDVAGSILEVIEREHADMVVISTHGMSGWYPMVFGSIAEKVVKLVHCPLMLLRTPKPASTAQVKSGRMMEWW